MTRAATDDRELTVPQAARLAREVERLWSQAASPARATTANFTPRTTCQVAPCPACTAETFQMPVRTKRA
jgi:hypothetical protein